MTVTCPKGHSSSEPDFCSECGAKIAAQETPAPAPLSSVAMSSPDVCPDCGSHRPTDGSKFCELCGYNFETGAHGEIPLSPQPASAAAVAPPATTSAPAPESTPIPENTPGPEKWTVLVTIDPALKESGSPDPPAGWSPLSIPAERNTLLIGRSSQSRSIAPDIPLDFDSAVSHRHALLTRSNGSDWSIRDIGSANGTRLNGQDIQAMVDVPLKPGDRITLGHWTCLTLSNESQTLSNESQP
jgi:DNA-directed RNA polymerase subunit RPC12/RpoP